MKKLSAPKRWPQTRPKIRWFARIVVGGVTALAFCILVRFEIWPLELVNHFVRQLLLLSTASLILAIALRQKWEAIASFLAVIVFTSALWNTDFDISLYNSNGSETALRAIDEQTSRLNLRVLTFNTYYRNSNPGDVFEKINSLDADVILLQEVSKNFSDLIRNEKNTNDLDFVLYDVPGTYEYMALMSRFRILNWDPIQPSPNSWGGILASIELQPALTIKVVCLHAFPPLSSAKLAERDAYLRHVSHIVATLDEPVIVGGDFNATPYTPVFRKFLRDTNLRGGVFAPATWPSSVGALGIPIDHILAREFLFRDLVSYPGSGSDHAIVLANLLFAPSSDPFSSQIGE